MVTDSRKFRSSIIKLGLPIALQDLISAGLGLIDAILLSRLGEITLAAVGLAGQTTFMVSIILFGAGSGSTVLLSQFRGKSDPSGVRAVYRMTLYICLLVSIPFAAVAILSPKAIMSAMSPDPRVIGQGADYLRIVALSFPLAAFSTTITAGLRSKGLTLGPAAVSLCVLVVNTYLTLALALGFGNIPALGAVGAAFALCLSRVLELVCLLRLSHKGQPVGVGESKSGVCTARGSVFLRSLGLGEYLRVVLPVIGSEGLWAMASVLTMGVFAHLGTRAAVAYHIAVTVQGLVLVGAVGLSNSCAILISRKIGEGSKEEARKLAGISLGMAWWLGAGLCGLLFAMAPYIASLFDISHGTKLLAIQALRVTAALSVLACTDYVLNMGVLRGGGDTGWSLAVDMGFLWTLGVPIAVLAALVFRLPLPWCMALASIELGIKVSIGILRVQSGLWLHDLTGVKANQEMAG